MKQESKRLMREIKFRGKSYKTGEWLYGDLIRNIKDELAILPKWSCKVGDRGARIINPAVYEVDVESVGQYTGLKDSNGKEIYEGDILMFHAFLPDVLQDRHLVGWSEDYGFCQWEYVDKEDSKGNIKRIKRSEPYTLYGVSHGTIIGNIHDNPELLKGGVE